MSELIAAINRHDHDPARGNAPIRWECIEGKPEPGVIERVYSVEVLGAQLNEIYLSPARYLVLPGRARYNAGYGLASLSEDARPLVAGTDWREEPRANAASLPSALYWTHRVRIERPKNNSVYRFTWREKIITDYIHGLRRVHIQYYNGKQSASEPGNLYANNYPNGIAWDVLPDGYAVEVWRKTRHGSRRWMLYISVPASSLALLLPSAASRGTWAYRFAYLRPDGARSLLSLETAVLHAREGWGAAISNKKIQGGRLLLK